MLNKLENFDSGSNYRFGDKLDKPNVKRSLLDLSHTVATSYPVEGRIISLTSFETLIGDDIEISLDALCRFQPLTLPPYSRSRVFFYAFYSRYSDLWTDFQAFIRKGTNGNFQGSVPVLNPNNSIYNTSVNDVLSYPDSDVNFAGVPLGASYANFVTGASKKFDVSALPFMMNFRVWRDYFCCKDEYINDTCLFPYDDARFRLNSDGYVDSFYQVTQGSSHKKLIFAAPKINIDANHGYVNSTPNSTLNAYFTEMWHEFAQDYFTSAKPFQQRGQAVGIPVNIPSLGISANQSDGFFTSASYDDNMNDYYWVNANPDGDTVSYYPFGFRSTPAPATGYNFPFGIRADASFTNIEANFAKALEANIKTKPLTNGSIQIPISDLRIALINQLELERLAHTDGSYAQFGITFFGEKPKSAVDFRPVYIGGTVKPILFSQVLQTSQTTTGSDASVLGSYAGHGIVGVNNGYLGRIHCDDYGMIQIYAVILPDTYYSQGIPKYLTRTLQEEFFLPGRERLGMQPILNKEIYAFGPNPDGLFAYQDSWDEFRYIDNKVKGKLADSSNASYFNYTQSRFFTSQPNWGHAFSTTQGNVRNGFYTSSSEDICSMQVSFNIRCVRALPYRPTTGQIIN